MIITNYFISKIKEMFKFNKMKKFNKRKKEKVQKIEFYF